MGPSGHTLLKVPNEQPSEDGEHELAQYTCITSPKHWNFNGYDMKQIRCFLIWETSGKSLPH